MEHALAVDLRSEGKICFLAKFATLALRGEANLAKGSEPNWLTWVSKENFRNYILQGNLAKNP